MANDPINAFRVEKAALDLLEEYGIEQRGFEIEDLAAAENLEIRRGVIRNVEAWLLRKPGGGGIIRLREDIAETGRVRFSVGHELGHWKMHPALSQGFLCTTKDFSDYVRSPPEIEANLFAANLLMPRKWIPPEVFRIDPAFAIPSDLAHDFRTTLTASTRRYVELSKHAVVLVFSRGGIVEWSLKSPAAKPLFIERDVPLPDYCLTRECLANGASSKAPESIEPEIWFPNWRFDDDSEVFEDVRISTTYGWAMTMLWVPELG